MQLRSRHDRREPEPLWRRVDRAVRDVNPMLLVLAMGLALLYLTCLLGLHLEFPKTVGQTMPPVAAVPPPGQ